MSACASCFSRSGTDLMSLWGYSSCYSCCCCCWGDYLRKKPKAPSFQIGSGWNLTRIFSSKYSSVDEVIFSSGAIQDDSHDVISCRTVLLPGVCILSNSRNLRCNLLQTAYDESELNVLQATVDSDVDSDDEIGSFHDDGPDSTDQEIMDEDADSLENGGKAKDRDLEWDSSTVSYWARQSSNMPSVLVIGRHRTCRICAAQSLIPQLTLLMLSSYRLYHISRVHTDPGKLMNLKFKFSQPGKLWNWT